MNLAARRAVLVTALLWFAFWGNAVFSASKDRQTAEQEAFLADARHDWAAAEGFRSDARLHARALAIGVAWGVGLPLIFLAAFELRRVQARRRARSERV